MGKRKSSKKPVTKKKSEPLASVFKCLFCNHEKAVSVKLDKQSMFGHLICKVCGQRYTSPINNLSVAVDVYCDWVDACEDIRAQQPAKKRAPRGPSPLSHGVAGGASFDPSGGPHEDDEDALGEIDEETDRQREGYAGEEDYEDDVGTTGEKTSRNKRYEDDEDEDDVDEVDEVEGDRGKRRRVQEYDDEDEDE